MTLLLPPEPIKQSTDTLQIAVIDIEHPAPSPPSRNGSEQCSVREDTFSLVPASGGQGWDFQSPSARGWSTPGVYENANKGWPLFLSRLAHIASEGCFGKSWSVDAIQERLVESMPIPADQALRFYYSLGSYGFVTLYPGMQLAVETAEISAKKKLFTHSLLFSVQARSPVGVSLSLVPPDKHLGKDDIKQATELLNTFAPYPFIRLFLEQGAIAAKKTQPAILLGAKTQDLLDTLAATIESQEERVCEQRGQEAACLIFPENGVSLLSSVTVNGHSALYAPGTNLAQILDAVPTPKRERAMQTVTVQRRFREGFVAVQFPRQQQAFSSLVLLNQDRINWK